LKAGGASRQPFLLQQWFHRMEPASPVKNAGDRQAKHSKKLARRPSARLGLGKWKLRKLMDRI
jgi:hypothetical protein